MTPRNRGSHLFKLKMCLNVKKFKRKGEYKETTWNGKKGEKYEVNTWVKCGTCAECMNEKANAWLVRNSYEQKAHEIKCFITLTYAKNPIYLKRKDIQNFFKRLRKHLEKTGEKIRYYGCGEYGTKFGRPHYHAIIYGWKPKDSKFKDVSKKGCLIFESEELTKIWGHGITTVQKAENKTIPYMALYNTPNEEGKRPIRIKKEQLIKDVELNKHAKHNLERKLMKLKGDYAEIKEFNFYSTGIGWNEFVKDYERKALTFTHYIGKNEIPTPSCWIKQMANEGEIYAMKEMKRRKEVEIIREQTIEERKSEKQLKVASQHVKDVIEKIEKPIENNYF